MSDDRRASVRRRVQLPFHWSPVNPEASPAELCEALGLPPTLAALKQLADLDEELARTVGALTDSRMVETIRVLDRKLDVLQEAMLAQLPVPDSAALELSADGIGFEVAQPLAMGAWLGVHLVLPATYHLVCLARVSHCDPAADGGRPRAGAAFHALDPAAGRRLTRYTIGRDLARDP